MIFDDELIPIACFLRKIDRNLNMKLLLTPLNHTPAILLEKVRLDP